jgi:hypothetical protein
VTVVEAEHLGWAGLWERSLGSASEGEQEIWILKWQSWGNAEAASSTRQEGGEQYEYCRCSGPDHQAKKTPRNPSSECRRRRLPVEVGVVETTSCSLGKDRRDVNHLVPIPCLDDDVLNTPGPVCADDSYVKGGCDSAGVWVVRFARAPGRASTGSDWFLL